MNPNFGQYWKFWYPFIGVRIDKNPYQNGYQYLELSSPVVPYWHKIGLKLYLYTNISSISVKQSYWSIIIKIILNYKVLEYGVITTYSYKFIQLQRR